MYDWPLGIAERLKTGSKEIKKFQQIPKIPKILGSNVEHPAGHTRGRLRHLC